MISRNVKRQLTALVVMLLPGLTTSAAAAGASSYQLPGGAAEYGDPYIAAGFRALFTCSAHFAMQRPLADIIAVELADTAALELPEPEIDVRLRLVRASDGRGNTVIAAFRDTMGCTLLPPDWTEADVVRLPFVARDLPEHDPEQPFPIGDDNSNPPDPRLEAIVSRAFDAESYGSDSLTAAVVVIQNGQIIAERYRPGFGIYSGYRTWSTAKSISATLIGIAVSQRLLDLTAPAPIPEWQSPGDPRRDIQLDHLLWMSSGLWSGGSNSYASYFAGQDVISAATTTHLETEPGSRWKYANNDTLLALRALRHALNDDLRYLHYPYRELLHRIGMYNTWMEVDHDGNFIGSSQVYTTARDLARFGLLYVNDGLWQNERILPRGWADFVATPAPSRPPEAGQRGYGAQFWLFDQLPGIPAGTYTTAGNKGQFVTIVPSHDLVIVRTGVDPLGVRWQQPAFVAELIAALEN